MCEIMKNVSSLQEYIVPPCSSTLEQFNMISEHSVWSKFAYCKDKVELENTINFIKNFIMNEGTVSLMISKIIDKAFYIPGFIEMIRELCDHEYEIESDIEDDADGENVIGPPREPCRVFRRYVVNEIQNKFESSVQNISLYPSKMLSFVIVLSKLFTFGFFSRITLAKICGDLVDKVNDSNRTFVRSYLDIILRICTAKLFETDDGRQLRKEIFTVKNTI